MKGLVAELVHVARPEASSALEVAAGGKLYHVVVEDAQTAKALLARGRLQRRVTILPLDKMKPSRTSDDVIRAAKKLVRACMRKKSKNKKRERMRSLFAFLSLFSCFHFDMFFSSHVYRLVSHVCISIQGGSKSVDLALSLVGYADEVSAAMEHIFGRTLVCSTMDIAQKVTFHGSVMTRSVTLEGDVFDPAGTLSGGARAQSAGILLKLQVRLDVLSYLLDCFVLVYLS